MLKRLFSPLPINGCMINNRLVVTAMVMNYCNHDGSLTEKYIAYHEAKAKGGWGLIVTENYAISEHAMGYDRIPGLWHDGQIEKNIELTDRIHAYDSKIFCQIYHAGRQSHHGVNGGVQPVAPSSIPCPWKREMPSELSVEEIAQIVRDFGDCALRAKKSGFDGIEIHAAHGYLLAEFLSPYSNKRVDEYGGCLKNRARIVHEIIDTVRNQVGQGFPIMLRLSADECVEGGRTIAETRTLCMLFEEWSIDAINLSSGLYGSYNKGVISTMYIEPAWVADYAEEVKKVVNIPVLTVNRINDPLVAEAILKATKADFIGIGRGSLADPDFPNKARSGDFEAIRPCIACLQGCVFMQELPEGSKCLVNPTLGREYELDYSITSDPKNVLVVGGGPGGLMAAYAAALKGHKVKLVEKQDFLGGQFKSAAYPPCKGGLSTFVSWVSRELNKLGVEIVLNQELTQESVLQECADEVILAVGGTPLYPPIKGIDNPIVQTAEKVLLGQVQPGNRIVVAGGGEVGGETAAHLAMQERGVSIVEMTDQILKELDPITKKQLMAIMEKYGVEQYISTKVVEITNDGVMVETKDGDNVFLPADMVVLAMGYKPNSNLVQDMSGTSCNVKVVGGAIRTSNALVAIEEGFFAGFNL